MTRAELIEATIDYVMTRMRDGQSVNGTWVMKQDRDIRGASRYMKMPDPNALERGVPMTREEVIEAILEAPMSQIEKTTKGMKSKGTRGVFRKESERRGYSDVLQYARDVANGKVVGNKKRATLALRMQQRRQK